jgi:hypothetical protein
MFFGQLASMSHSHALVFSAVREQVTLSAKRTLFVFSLEVEAIFAEMREALTALDPDASATWKRVFRAKLELSLISVIV